MQPGKPITREDLPTLLADADNWDYPDSSDWIGCLASPMSRGPTQQRGEFWPHFLIFKAGSNNES
ncbi:hypothetical protein OG887_39380 [Streptomyces sp. NBC_00053]|uniref:hypothetical protein n=1 Tax=unclassified Streptomyces TaxID=2593676 RepID=UPI000FC1D953|nr:MULTISPECIES: hypothetical protein [unclassified Streptomyces]WSG48568.1 hypothetical protein OHA38_01270 [Streptomyces sp. NBC_01732]WSW99218.1 hypothetical protein OG355_01385 [Streptomyces sp. NBC_00987]MCX4399338.1 hypothetical protein [Streptomyces sp. NBC_01767]MCX5103217.1 hypothetical protein [Streptomyces sp. NBC_00439]MCX5166047.1 hypothetical protein [Streptomyces sp. NBC_00305]